VLDRVSSRERVAIGAVRQQAILDSILVPKILDQEQAGDDKSEDDCQSDKCACPPVIVVVFSQWNLPPGTGNYPCQATHATTHRSLILDSRTRLTPMRTLARQGRDFSLTGSI
jgi:hypothetical protein